MFHKNSWDCSHLTHFKQETSWKGKIKNGKIQGFPRIHGNRKESRDSQRERDIRSQNMAKGFSKTYPL